MELIKQYTTLYIHSKEEKKALYLLISQFN